MACQSLLKEVTFKTPDGQTQAYSMEVQASRSDTRDARLLVLTDIHQLMDMWDSTTPLTSDEVIMKSTLSGLERYLDGMAT